MSAAHRRPSQPFRSAIELTLVGLFICLLIFGTDLELWAGTWIMSVAVLARALVEGNRRLTWLAVSTAALASWQVLGAFAKHAGWPPGDQHVITSIGDWTRWLGLVLLVGLILTELRSWVGHRRNPSAQDGTESS
jgi:hypothetical protein